MWSSAGLRPWTPAFLHFTAPLGVLVQKYGINYHFYADDSQLYLSFRLSSEASALSNLEKFVNEIRGWMYTNKLELNDNKSEFVVLGSRAQAKRHLWVLLLLVMILSKSQIK